MKDDDFRWVGAARIIHALRDLPEGSAPGGDSLVFDPGAGPIASNPHASDAHLMFEALTTAQCAAVCELASTRPAFIGEPREYRQCRNAWLDPAPDCEWLYRRVAEIFEQANRRFRFRLCGLIESIMVVEYEQGEGFDWHLDSGPSLAANRKLSLTIQLSAAADYDGGSLEFSGKAVPPEASRQGTAIVFPPFLAHRISRIERGRRRSLVAWAYGPTFS